MLDRGPFQDTATGTSQCVSAACAVSAEHPGKTWKKSSAHREKNKNKKYFAGGGVRQSRFDEKNVNTVDSKYFLPS